MFPVDTEASAHGPETIVYDGFGEGWRIECLCGYMTEPWKSIEGAGSDMDEHLKEQV